MIKLLYIDLFCGAGGTSTGVENAIHNGLKCAKVIACVNHDANAIASHKANHPDALHYTEDIRTLELSPLTKYVDQQRKEYPGAKVVLWASLECTNFSKAKGGLPRDADSRTLAEHLFRYIDALCPDYIQIENVEEFMSWGDLDERGKPVSRDAGRLYRQWVNNVKKCGYNFDHRILNAADYGAYTSRKRFFGQFAKPDLPIAWPEPTHSKDGGSDLFGSLEKWKPVRDVLDFEDAGKSIFGRKKPLVDATLERIYAGLIKFVAGGKEAFMVKYNSMSRKGVYHPPSLDDPCPVVATQGRLGLAQAHFLSKYYSGHPDSKNIGVDVPAGAITTKDSHALVGAQFLTAYYGNGFVHGISEPSPTVTTKDRFSLVKPCFIANSYSGGGQLSDIEKPSPAILSYPKQNLVKCHFIDQQFGQSKPASIENPCGALTKTPKYNLVCCKPWVMNTNFSNVGSSIDSPAQTITANRKWHYLMNPQYFSAGGSIDKPCFTLIARMDKAPPYLISAESEANELPAFIKPFEGGLVYEIYPDDTPPMVKIKEFMAIYLLSDITMRMLRIVELKQIQGFPKDYVLIGTQEEQKKYIGNAVVTEQAEALCMATAQALKELKKVA